MRAGVINALCSFIVFESGVFLQHFFGRYNTEVGVRSGVAAVINLWKWFGRTQEILGLQARGASECLL